MASLVNHTATPAATAAALVTAMFGMFAEAAKLKAGKIGREEFKILRTKQDIDRYFWE